jgi:hypothetical protein
LTPEKVQQPFRVVAVFGNGRTVRSNIKNETACALENRRDLF